MADLYDITLTAPATRVAVGSGDPIEITVTVDGADGGAASDGVRVAMTTDLGALGYDDAGDPLTTVELTLAGSTARCRFFAGDTVGTAQLLAMIDDSFDDLTIDVVPRA